jgi:hypothetical protein
MFEFTIISFVVTLAVVYLILDWLGYLDVFIETLDEDEE